MVRSPQKVYDILSRPEVALYSENALLAMMEMRAERADRRGPQPGLWGWINHKSWRKVTLLSLLWMALLPVLVETFTLFTVELSDLAKIIAIGFSLLLVGYTVALWFLLPFRQLGHSISLLSSLRAGGGLTELMGTGMRGSELLDALAHKVAWQTVKQGSPYLIPLVLGYLLAGMPALGASLLCGLWPLVTYPMVAATAYICMMSALCMHSHESFFDVLVKVLASLVVLPSMAFYVAILAGLARLSESPVTAVELVMGSVLLYLLVHLAVSRTLALTALDRLPRIRQKIDLAGRRFLVRCRNGWMRPWSENPIVVRETHREAQRTPGGFLGWFFLRLPAVWVVGLSALGIFSTLVDPLRGKFTCVFWSCMVILTALSFLLSVRRTMGALVTEVETSTLDVLRQTRLSVAELCNGWFIVGARNRYLEMILLSPLFLGCYLQGDVEMVSVLKAWVVLLLVPAYGAWVGLWASAGFSHSQANHRLSSALGLSLFLALFIVFIASWVGFPGGLCLVLVLVLGAGSLLSRGLLFHQLSEK